MIQLPTSWKSLEQETHKAYFRGLTEFVDRERLHHEVYPDASQVFAALEATSFANVRVLLLGQDPYHGQGQAHGLCFSVPRGVKPPPSLRNIFKELVSDVGCEVPTHGCLVGWAYQGVLLLNTVLTVRSNQANSHRDQGWETFTDAVIAKVNSKSSRVVFVLWGNPARKKKKLIDQHRHAIIESAHPSPLSANRGFFGSRPFSRINEELRESGQAEIDWVLDH